MSLSDPIADYLVRVRNAIAAKHEKVDIPSSRVKVDITRILKEEGFIQNFKITEDPKQGTIRIFLKYSAGASVITGLKQISRPGCRVYAKKESIPKVIGGMGVSIISTSRGIMTGDQSLKSGVGGEILCEVW